MSFTWSAMTFLGGSVWSISALRHIAGKACFIACFRRPLFAMLDQLIKASLNEAPAVAPTQTWQLSLLGGS